MMNSGRRAVCLISILILSHILSSPLHAQDLSGWINLRGSLAESFEDGKKMNEISSINQSNQLGFTNFLTLNLNYNLSLSTRYIDTHSTDANGATSSSYLRTLSPAFDISFNAPVYTISAGYLRDEQWSSESLSNENRKTFDNIYTRFDMIPRGLPSLSLQFDRGRNFDHLSDQKTDETSTQYTVNSTYHLPSDVLQMSYAVSFSHNVFETPLLNTTESVNDNLNVTLDIGYTRFFWREIGMVSIGHLSNYRWDSQEQTVQQTGAVLFRRNPFGGLYAKGTDLKPDVDILESTGWSSLVDGNFDSSVNINLGSDRFHNIGIWIPSDKPVDRLYIYVDTDTSTDLNLTDRENWKVYRSNFNQAGTWSEIPLRAVTVKEVFVAQDFRHRYEIEFLTPSSASYFKAVNLETTNALGAPDVLVTEIEAYGTDTVPETGIISDDSEAFEQGLNLTTTLKPHRKLSLTFDYSINRSDENIDSVLDSYTGTFKNMFSDSIDKQNEDFISRFSRNYGAAARWLTHRLVTTSLSYRRSESLDSIEETDTESNNYNLSIRYTPLPTLGTSFILTRSENLSFGEKITTDNSAILSVDAKLYKDIHMTTDFSHIETETFGAGGASSGGSTSSANAIRGIIDASFTKDLFANFRYNLLWMSSDNDDSPDSREASVRVTYRPGRLISMSGLFEITSSGGDTTITEGLNVDWMPLPAIRITSSYRRTDFPGNSTLETFSTIGNWRITRFLYAWISYNFRKNIDDKESKDHSVSANLNCRF